MLYLILKRDMEKISLARKHVLYVGDLYVIEKRSRLDHILEVVCDRTGSLESEQYGPGFPASELTRFIGIFEQQNLVAEDQFKIFAKGLVRALVLPVAKKSMILTTL